MVSRTKFKASIGIVNAELEMIVEGTPLVSAVDSEGKPLAGTVDDLMNRVNNRVMDLRAFNWQFENHSLVNMENDEVEETNGEIKPNLEVKPATSELEQKLENKIESDIMVA